MKTTLSIRALLKESYGIMKPRLWRVIGQFALVGCLYMAASLLAGTNPLLGILVSVFFGLYLTLLSVRYAREGTTTLGDVFDMLTWKGFAYFFLVFFLVRIVSFLGLILLIVPGIILAVRLSLAKYLAADKHVAPIEACRESYRLTRGHGWKIFWFAIAVFFVNLAGLLCLVVGLFFTMPLTLIAFGLLYKKLTVSEEETVSAEKVEETVVDAVIKEAEAPAVEG